MHLSSKNQKVIVTGAAQGIGRAICDAFTSSGADVIGTDIDRTSLNEVPQQTDW
jgi:NAD(P)-dependent dehydrogenase (short-subunit alcohol dehydrogenase family)